MTPGQEIAKRYDCMSDDAMRELTEDIDVAVVEERERAARMLENAKKDWPDEPQVRAVLTSYAGLIRIGAP